MVLKSSRHRWIKNYWINFNSLSKLIEYLMRTSSQQLKNVRILLENSEIKLDNFLKKSNFKQKFELFDNFRKYTDEFLNLKLLQHKVLPHLTWRGSRRIGRFDNVHFHFWRRKLNDNFLRYQFHSLENVEIRELGIKTKKLTS